MNPSLLGGAFALLLVLFWWGGRSRPRLLRSHDASAVAALNRQQIERLRQQDADVGPDPGELGGIPAPAPCEAAPEPPLQMPQRLRWRHQRLLRLAAQLRDDPHGRRQALLELQRWRDPAALPLLRRSLHDPDPEVVRLAAQGLERFRGRRWFAAQALAPSGTAVAPARPRNVARTR